MISIKGNNIFYLYGVHKATWLHMNYIEAFKLKNKLADGVLSDILSTPMLDRDNVRQNKVIDAIKYNNERLAE